MNESEGRYPLKESISTLRSLILGVRLTWSILKIGWRWKKITHKTRLQLVSAMVEIDSFSTNKSWEQQEFFIRKFGETQQKYKGPRYQVKEFDHE